MLSLFVLSNPSCATALFWNSFVFPSISVNLVPEVEVQWLVIRCCVQFLGKRQSSLGWSYVWHLHMYIKCIFYFLPLYSTYTAADKTRQMHFHWQRLTECFGVERIFGDGILHSLSPLHHGRIDCFITKWSLMDEYWVWASVKSEDDNSVLLMPLEGEVNLLNCLEVLQFPIKCLKQSFSTFAMAWPTFSSYPPFYPCI